LSKVATNLFTIELQKRLGDSGATTCVLHPGYVRTDILRHQKLVMQLPSIVLSPLILKNSKEGAQTTLYCATQPNIRPGEYYCDCKVAPSSLLSNDPKLASDLWEYSERLVQT